MKQTLGNFIAALRKEKNMTQRQLAEILGVSDKTVSHWEREESSPDISLLPIIASLFEITVDELLAGEKKHSEAAAETAEAEASDEAGQNENTMLLLLEQRMNEFKTQNIICNAVSILALLCGFFVDSVLYRGSTFVCLFVVVIALTMSLIYRSRFEQSMRKSGLAEDTLTPYRHKANRISSIGCYLSALVVFLTAMAEYQDEFVMYFCGAIFITAVIFVEIMLRQADILKLKTSKKVLSCFVVSAVSFALIFCVIFGSAELHNNYTFGYFVRKNAEKVAFYDKESLFEYMAEEKEKNWSMNDYTSSPGKTRVCALGDDTGYSMTDSIPEYRGYAYLDDAYRYFDWHNGEVCEIIISYEYPVEVITFEAYRKSYEENKYIISVANYTKYALPIVGTILIVFVQIAIMKRIIKGKSVKKSTKKKEI